MVATLEVREFLSGHTVVEAEEGIEVEQVFARMGNEYLSRYYNRSVIQSR